jgi:aerobic-type carbon monoxide dehydrogenase small subunit (CoxS/CutS family)
LAEVSLTEKGRRTTADIEPRTLLVDLLRTHLQLTGTHMIMSAIDMVRRNGCTLGERTVRRELEGNLCRCTGYHNIVKAIEAGAAAMKDHAWTPPGETRAGMGPSGE